MTTKRKATGIQAELIERLRDAISALREHSSIREVSMFGGVSFMINDKMVVAARTGGDLLVRADPKRNRELLAVAGAAPAQMGAGRVMGPSWISVAHDAVVSGGHLSFWIDVALDYNPRARRSGP